MQAAADTAGAVGMELGRLAKFEEGEVARRVRQRCRATSAWSVGTALEGEGARAGALR